MTIVFYLIVYNTVWFTCMLSAAKQQSWLAIIVASVAVILQALWQKYVENDTKDLLNLVCLMTLFGTLVDSLMYWLGLIVYQDNFFAPYLCPPWIIVLWPVFAMMCHALLRWLWQRTWLLSAYSLVGFTVAYMGGEQLGAAKLTYGGLSALVVGALWMVILPAILAQHAKRVARL